MKNLLKLSILSITLGLISCCDYFCERHKYAESIIQKVEKFKSENQRLPENVSEIELKETTESEAFYSKTSDSTYTVWYAIGFDSNVYTSETKEWNTKG
ncbi:hypothetical protein MG296_14500 [Flavobacteriaceae bacterium TK19130]|nr:hypothetical protein [Thermobacterium salinum]